MSYRYLIMFLAELPLTTEDDLELLTEDDLQITTET